MGDGFAIELTDSDVLAPVSGEIVNEYFLLNMLMA